MWLADTLVIKVITNPTALTQVFQFLLWRKTFYMRAVSLFYGHLLDKLLYTNSVMSDVIDMISGCPNISYVC